MAATREVVRLGILLSLLAASPPSPAQAEVEPTSPVLLELFTSQGCSSCPAAEELLSRLGLDERTRASVIPLAYHVDYWNRLGWWDPYSSRAWSLRQEAYERVLRVEGGAYTPQLVVNGRTELNGTQRARVLGEIDTARRRRPPARIEGTARMAGAEEPAVALDVSVEILEPVAARKLQLRVALFESGLVTQVERGENAGRTLRNDFIVRWLETAFSLASVAGTRRQGLLDLKLERGWKAENLGLAAFLQDPRTLRIHAAVVLPLEGRPARRTETPGGAN
ncbi:MAG: DUF1223 domain-containing protein [Vicinamibacteria bacterium]